MQKSRLPHSSTPCKQHYYWRFITCVLIFCVATACSKRDITTENTEATKSVFTVDGARVLNASFSVAITTENYRVLAGGDGSIIYRSCCNKHWHAANTKGISDNITSLSNHGNELIATGENGLVAYSADEGKTWKKISVPSTQNIYSSTYDSQYKSWIVVGAEGTILRTDTPDKPWQTITIEGGHQDSAITSIKYLSATKTLLAIGDHGLLLTSVDGGTSWSKISIDTTANLNTQITLANKTTIILTSEGNALRNEGDLLQWQNVVVDKDKNLINLAYDNNNLIAISDAGNIYIGADNGKTWGISHNNDQPLRSILYTAKQNTMIAAGGNGAILYSVDGGNVWNKGHVNIKNSTSNIETNIEALVEIDDEIFALGDGGLIASSTDGGKNWDLQQESITAFIHQIVAASDNKNVVALGANGLLLQSNNAGASWNTANAKLNSNDYLFSAITDKKSGRIVAAGSPGTIIQSNGSNQPWQITLALGDANKGQFHKLISDNNNTLVALSGPGTSYYSTNGGAHWQPATINNEQHLFNGLYDSTNRHFIAVGNAGTVQLSDNGKDWEIIPTGTTENLQGIYASENFLFVTGSNGVILRSDDGGKHWQLMNSNTNIAIQYVYALNKSEVLIATGLKGLILRSTDAGKNWQVITNPESNNLREPVQDPETGIVYISSRSGNILYSQDTGKTWAFMPKVTQHSIKGLYLDANNKMLLGYGERLIRVRLLNSCSKMTAACEASD